MRNIKLKPKTKNTESPVKKIEIEIPEGKRAECVNGVLTLVDDKPIEYKFNVGDKVIYPRLTDASEIMTITERLPVNGYPCYRIATDKNVTLQCLEEDIYPYVLQDITDRIKTFGDACKWCNENGLTYLVDAHDDVCDKLSDYLEFAKRDILAYLKLRIITAALNEGWEPTFEDGEQRWYICVDEDDCGGPSICRSDGVITLTESSRLLFKSDTLAEYAANQFAGIYTDFWDAKKEASNEH